MARWNGLEDIGSICFARNTELLSRLRLTLAACMPMKDGLRRHKPIVSCAEAGKPCSSAGKLLACGQDAVLLVARAFLTTHKTQRSRKSVQDLQSSRVFVSIERPPRLSEFSRLRIAISGADMALAGS